MKIPGVPTCTDSNCGCGLSPCSGLGKNGGLRDPHRSGGPAFGTLAEPRPATGGGGSFTGLHSGKLGTHDGSFLTTDYSQGKGGGGRDWPWDIPGWTEHPPGGIPGRANPTIAGGTCWLYIITDSALSGHDLGNPKHGRNVEPETVSTPPSLPDTEDWVTSWDAARIANIAIQARVAGGAPTTLKATESGPPEVRAGLPVRPPSGVSNTRTFRWTPKGDLERDGAGGASPWTFVGVFVWTCKNAKNPLLSWYLKTSKGGDAAFDPPPTGKRDDFYLNAEGVPVGSKVDQEPLWREQLDRITLEGEALHGDAVKGRNLSIRQKPTVGATPREDDPDSPPPLKPITLSAAAFPKGTCFLAMADSASGHHIGGSSWVVVGEVGFPNKSGKLIPCIRAITVEFNKNGGGKADIKYLEGEDLEKELAGLPDAESRKARYKL